MKIFGVGLGGLLFLSLLLVLMPGGRVEGHKSQQKHQEGWQVVLQSLSRDPSLQKLTKTVQPLLKQFAAHYQEAAQHAQEMLEGEQGQVERLVELAQRLLQSDEAREIMDILRDLTDKADRHATGPEAGEGPRVEEI